MPTELVLFNDQAANERIRRWPADPAPGNDYTGGHSSTGLSQGDAPSADYLGNLTDRLDNFAIDIHECLVFDFSGTRSISNSSAS